MFLKSKAQLAWLASSCFASTEAFAPLFSLPSSSSSPPRVVVPFHTKQTNPLYSSTGSNDEECSLDADGDVLNECLLEEGYVNDNDADLMITRIYKAKLESLRDRFESRYG